MEIVVKIALANVVVYQHNDLIQIFRGPNRNRTCI